MAGPKLLARRLHDSLFSQHVYVARHGWLAGARRRGRMPWLQRELTDPAELRELEFFRGLRMPGGVAYDVGAGHGTRTWVLSGAVGSGGRVIAFEPEPEAFALLSELVSLNGLANVTVFAIALGETPRVGELLVPEGDVQLAGTLDERLTRVAQGSRLQVPVLPLDLCVERLGLPLPDLVKVDVEGLEVRVLEGGMGTLEHARPRLLVEIHGIEGDKTANADGVLRIMGELGYGAWHLETGATLSVTRPGQAAVGHIVGEPEG